MVLPEHLYGVTRALVWCYQKPGYYIVVCIIMKMDSGRPILYILFSFWYCIMVKPYE